MNPQACGPGGRVPDQRECGAKGAAKFQNAGIPLIAVEIPHPGAIYFGADNHRVGLLGGRCLGHFAMQQWQGSVDQILMLGVARSGALVRTRVDGMLDGIKDGLRRR